MNSLNQLFLVNFKIIFRNKSAVFWTIILPVSIYLALSILPIKNIIHTGFKYSSYVLPGIIAMTIMQSGIYSLAYWMVDLKTRGVIKRFLATPIKTSELVLSLLASRALMILFQVIALTVIGVWFFEAKFSGNIFSTLILVLLGGGIFLAMGLLISNFSDSYESAAPITSAIGLPLTFLGNVFYPIENLPHTLQVVAKFLPITYLADGLRQAYLYPFDLQIIGKDILILACWLVGILAVTIKIFRLKE